MFAGPLQAAPSTGVLPFLRGVGFEPPVVSAQGWMNTGPFSLLGVFSSDNTTWATHICVLQKMFRSESDIAKSQLTRARPKVTLRKNGSRRH